MNLAYLGEEMINVYVGILDDFKKSLKELRKISLSERTGRKVSVKCEMIIVSDLGSEI